MANISRQIGANIFPLMQDSGISREDLAEYLGYSLRDINRLIDGRLLISPRAMRQVADFFHVEKCDLLKVNDDHIIPQLQYMKEFENQDNLDHILDLLDDYIELKESV